MDDPLKPKTIPLDANTVLWFEFLLDPNLLTRHLNKSNSDPKALDLIAQFISVAPDTVISQYDLSATGNDALLQGTGAGTATLSNSTISTVESLNISRKQLALKILSLKVATFLKWNLDLFEKSLSISKQILLLRDLCAVSFGKLVNIPLEKDSTLRISPEGSENAATFALTLYHRWVLRLHILRDINTKTARTPLINMLVPVEPLNQCFMSEILPQSSIEYLKKLCSSVKPFYIFTYETFIALYPDSGSTKQCFDAMQEISLAELRSQIYFDLANFYLFTKQYKLAQETVLECRKNLEEIKLEYNRQGKASHFVFCHLNENELEGYQMACGVSDRLMTLMEKFNMSLLCQYKDIIEILKADNIYREIPFVNRRIVELDIEGAISQGILQETREFETKVAALNVIRCIFEQENIFSNVQYFEKYSKFNCFSAIAEGIADVFIHCSLAEQSRIKEFLKHNILKNSWGNFLQHIEDIGILTELEIQELHLQLIEKESYVSPLTTQVDWKYTSKITRIDIGSVERQLISCATANTVRKLLVRLAANNPSKPLWTVNPSWQIPTPINSLLMSLQRGFLQDFAYILLGKAREMTAKKDYLGAVSMLNVLKSETQRQELSNSLAVTKLGRLVNWEILLIQITECLDEWNTNTLDLQSLGNRCKHCLSSLQSNDNVIPRIEIIEHCAVMILNMCDYSSLMFLDNRISQLELTIAFAATFLDMEKMKGSRKMCHDAWDLILPIFLNSSNKRGNSNSRNSPSFGGSKGLQIFLKKIRDRVLFSLVISLLGKIHNILKDDANYDLNGEYMQFWPTTISNPISYNIRLVSETLNWLLKEALKYYPQHIAWMKMKGDLELAIGNNEAAMRCYVNSLITGTDFCAIPLQRIVGDDYVVRKMIRCSSNLSCHMQATVLCQFLEDVDYSIVFKNLSEKSSNFTDAMDAYYNCIWDTTLLEFIVNLHSKKGEHNRKLEAVTIMNTLELNANNNDEIKREAAAIRKSRFLRALAEQYLM